MGCVFTDHRVFLRFTLYLWTHEHRCSQGKGDNQKKMYHCYATREKEGIISSWLQAFGLLSYLIITALCLILEILKTYFLPLYDMIRFIHIGSGFCYLFRFLVFVCRC